MLRRLVWLTALVAGLLALGAGPAMADPALPSNYDSMIVEAPASDLVDVRIEGGDSFFVMEVEPGTEAMVPGYDTDDDFSDWPQLEQYARVLPDGTVQLNLNSQAYYNNQDRFGAQPPPGVGPDAEPDWLTVGDDGRIAWHDHRIHWMSPQPPSQVDTSTGGLVQEYAVPIIVNGELTVAEGRLEFVPERSPVLVGLLALVGLVAGGVLARRDRRIGAVLALVTGGAIVGLVLAATTGRAVGFDIATPPIALAGVGAVAPALGAFVPSLKPGQQRGLLLLGGVTLFAFGVLSTGVADGLVGGAGEGFGNWWTNPTLPTDVAPAVVRYAMALGTGLGVGLFAGVLADDSADRDELAELRTTPEPGAP